MVDSSGYYTGFGRSVSNNSSAGSHGGNQLKVTKTSRQLLQDLGRKPTEQEIADESGISLEKVREVIRISQVPSIIGITSW